MKITYRCLPLLSLLLLFPTAAVTSEGYQLYSRPEAPVSTEADYGKTCALLEQEIASLIPLTYSDKPSLHDDPYAGAAVTVGTVAAPIALTYLAYPVAFEHVEQAQIADVTLRIEALRQVKASKHCFED